MTRLLTLMVVSLCGASLVRATDVGSSAPALVWDAAAGVQLRTPVATVKWDQNEQLAAPVLKFAAAGELPLRNPRVTQPSDKQLNLAYEVTTPDGTTLQVTRELTLTAKEDSSSVATWGVKNYDLEVWDAEASLWKAVIWENKDRLMLSRVHVLPSPVRTVKFRVVVRAVAPADGIARLLQLEAWGTP